MGDFAGQLLVVNLSEKTCEWADLPEPMLRQFLGGRGLNAWFLSRHLPDPIDPLAAENVLVFSGGLLTGTEAPSSSRLHVGALSPLTGLLGSSNIGGHFGAALRAAGVQSVVIKGQAPHPVVLRIDGDQGEILKASELWNLDTRDTTQTLQSQLGPKTHLLVIGPAGENRVRYACVVSDTRHAAGRTGMGAVMGAKNLKAIAVSARHGGKRSMPSCSEEALQAVRDYAMRIRNAPRYETYARFSNSAFVNWANELGILATHNYREVQFPGAEHIDGSRLIDYVTRSRSCHRCPVHCKAEIEIREGRYGGTRGERPDIEPIVNLGSKCGLDDPEALLHLYNLTSTLGLDAISTAGVLAFAMDLYDHGILSAADTEGLELTWGNAEAMEIMIHHIAQRRGLGAVLAEGVRRAAQLIGRGAENYAYHCKGLELTAYDARGGMGTALGYAVSTRGGDFTSVYAVPEYRWTAEQGREWFGTESAIDRLSPEGKGQLVKRTMIVSAVLDALGICKVPALSILNDFSLEKESELIASLTGWNVGADELARAGERIINLERLLNARYTPEGTQDSLPDHFTEDPVITSGPTYGMTVDIQRLLRDFYAAMGWDDAGRPTQEKLADLELNDLP